MVLLALVFLALHVLGLVALSIAQHVRLRGGRMLIGLWIATCIIPMMGLAGTIAGLMGAFESVSSADPSQRASMLAEGISEAMNCTAFGLALFALFLTLTIVATVRTARASPRALRDLTPGPSPSSGEGSS